MSDSTEMIYSAKFPERGLTEQVSSIKSFQASNFKRVDAIHEGAFKGRDFQSCMSSGNHRGPTKSLQDLKELMMPLSFQCNLPRLQQYCEGRETILVMPKKINIVITGERNRKGSVFQPLKYGAVHQ